MAKSALVFVLSVTVMVLIFVTIALRAEQAESRKLEEKLEESLEAKDTCDLRMISLYHGRCEVVTKDACERTWASFDSPARATSMHGVGPIGCPLASDIPWVNPRGLDPNEWSFICAPQAKP